MTLPRTKPIDLEARRAERRHKMPEVLSPEQLRRRAMANIRHNLASLADEKYETAKKWLDDIYMVDGPKAAFDAYLKLLEFAVPKLSRAEVVNDPPGSGGKRELTMEELQEMVMCGIKAKEQEAKTIDGEVEDATFDVRSTE